MIRSVLMCLPLLAVVAAAQENFPFEAASAAARTPINAAPQPMSSYKESTRGHVYSAYIFEDHNAHGDTGAVFVSFEMDKDGKLVEDSVWANFSVGCPQEECEEGEVLTPFEECPEIAGR